MSSEDGKLGTFFRNERRTHLSTETFKAACPIKASVIPFHNLCDKQEWTQHIKLMKEHFSKTDYGFNEIDKKILLSIIEKRKSLYDRWYGKRNSLEDYIDIVLDQGAMYATMGSVLHKYYKHYLIFGADNKIMRFFYSVTKRTPTLYLNKKYS